MYLVLVVLAIKCITIYIVFHGGNLTFGQAFYTFFWSLYVLQEGYVSGILVTMDTNYLLPWAQGDEEVGGAEYRRGQYGGGR